MGGVMGMIVFIVTGSMVEWMREVHACNPV